MTLLSETFPTSRATGLVMRTGQHLLRVWLNRRQSRRLASDTRTLNDRLLRDIGLLPEVIHRFRN